MVRSDFLVGRWFESVSINLCQTKAVFQVGYSSSSFNNISKLLQFHFVETTPLDFFIIRLQFSHEWVALRIRIYIVIQKTDKFDLDGII